MQRIKTSGTLEVIPTPEESSISPGFFGGGNPSTGQLPTVVGQDWLNSVQEELVSVIHKAGITLDVKDNTQLLKALDFLFGGTDPFAGYAGEFRSFYLPSPPKGWVQRNGALIANASITVPVLYQALRSSEYAWLLISESQWQTMSNALPWNGIGGVPYFVLNTSANTIRLPDTRGMYEEGAGFDGLAVGGVHSDMIRNITGRIESGLSSSPLNTNNISTIQNGIFSWGDSSAFTVSDNLQVKTLAPKWFDINVGRQVPVGPANKPRAYGVLHCVYTG